MRKKDITIAQLRALVAVCDNDLNVTAAAAQLKTVQPSVSKKLMTLEKQIGKPLFLRNGKRFLHETELCQEVVKTARRILLQCDNIAAFVHGAGGEVVTGELSIGTTHTQGRYTLPSILCRFRSEYPNIQLNITQGSPVELVRLLNNNTVDMVICTEMLAGNSNFRILPMLSWNRCLIGYAAHPLFSSVGLTLKKLAAYPLITYVHGFTGRAVFDETFAKAELAPTVAVSASDSDIIKTYVRFGFGCGVIAEMAYQPDKDSDLAMRSLAELFPDMCVYIAYQREKFIPSYMQRFIELAATKR